MRKRNPRKSAVLQMERDGAQILLDRATAELAQARAAAEKLIRHIEAVECVACPYRRDICSMGHDEPCYTRIKEWAYAAQEVVEE